MCHCTWLGAAGNQLLGNLKKHPKDCRVDNNCCCYLIFNLLVVNNIIVSWHDVGSHFGTDWMAASQESKQQVRRIPLNERIPTVAEIPLIWLRLAQSREDSLLHHAESPKNFFVGWPNQSCQNNGNSVSLQIFCNGFLDPKLWVHSSPRWAT